MRQKLIDAVERWPDGVPGFWVFFEEWVEKGYVKKLRRTLHLYADRCG